MSRIPSILCLALLLGCCACKPRAQLERERADREKRETEPTVERFGSEDFKENEFLPKTLQSEPWVASMPGVDMRGFKEGLRQEMGHAKRPLKK